MIPNKLTATNKVMIVDFGEVSILTKRDILYLIADILVVDYASLPFLHLNLLQFYLCFLLDLHN
jgi:hypothetical protein